MAEPKVLDVPTYEIDPDAGDLGVYVLTSLQEFFGNSKAADYPTLKAVSGDGFKFVYDEGEVYEAMQHLCPTDFIRDGLAFYGIEGSWETGLTLDEAWDRINSSLEQEWPVITSNLLGSQPGYQIILGAEEDEDERRIAVHGGRQPEDVDGDGRTYRWQRFDREWDGPVSSRARWDLNPLFVIESVDLNTRKREEELVEAVQAGLRVCEQFEIPYGTSGLDETYAAVPLAGRVAGHGADAWGRLVEDVADKPDLANFVFLWKLDIISRRLAHDRQSLAEFFMAHGKRKRGDNAAALKDLSAVLEEIADGARELGEYAWYETPEDIATPEDFQQMMARSSALAYPVPQHRGFPDRLREMGYDDRMFNTVRGEAILMGDAVRWQSLARVVDRVADLDASIEMSLRRYQSE